MKVLIKFIFLYNSIVSGGCDFCDESFRVNELPRGILKEMLSFLTLGTFEHFVGCHNEVVIEPNDIKYYQYTRKNPNVPVRLDPSNLTSIDKTKQIIFLMPGWLCNVTNDRIPKLKEAYLREYDANIIGIDWTKFSIDLYTISFCAVPEAAKRTAKFICDLHSQLNVDLSSIHIVGHSMGAQLAGLTGQEIQKKCNLKLGRITGLDPAGPLYQGLQESRRLDASDALFVDVIHSNMGFFGYYGSCGTVDFFPNCGTHQPGCLRIDILNILHTPLKYIACSHLRSADYMAESISSVGFVSTSCLICPGIKYIGICVPDLIFKSYSVMGEHCPNKSSSGKYYLATNRKYPYVRNNLYSRLAFESLP